MFTAVAVTDEDILTELTAVAGKLNGVKIGLYTNNVTWNKNTVLTDVTECTFTGYAKVAVTWTTPFRATDGTYRVSSGLNVFQPTAASTETAVGYFITDTAGTVLLGGDAFPAPVPLPDALTRCAFTFDWNGSNASQGIADQVA